jgi:acetyl-CoA carboxylase carboxyltransferase component
MTTQDDLLNELHQHREQIEQGGGAARIEAQHAKGERIACLLDEGTFQAIDPYMAHRHSDFGPAALAAPHPGDSVTVGFGKIGGRKVAVYAQDFTALGGSFSEVQGQKVAEIMDMALER